MMLEICFHAWYVNTCSSEVISIQRHIWMKRKMSWANSESVHTAGATHKPGQGFYLRPSGRKRGAVPALNRPKGLEGSVVVRSAVAIEGPSKGTHALSDAGTMTVGYAVTHALSDAGTMTVGYAVSHTPMQTSFIFKLTDDLWSALSTSCPLRVICI